MIDNKLLQNTNAMMKIIRQLSEYKFTPRNSDSPRFFSITGFYVSSALGTPFIELSEVDIGGNFVKDGDSIEVELPDPRVNTAFAALLDHGLVPVVTVPETSNSSKEPEEECDCPDCSTQDTEIESLSALFNLILGLDKGFKH